ncbi:hypothetical protein [Bacteroides sp. 224]|nr:hypothetical protein [Bacteroides sp. 224]
MQFTPEFAMAKGVGRTRSQFKNVEYVLWGGKGSGSGDEFIDPSV